MISTEQKQNPFIQKLSPKIQKLKNKFHKIQTFNDEVSKEFLKEDLNHLNKMNENYLSPIQSKQSNQNKLNLNNPANYFLISKIKEINHFVISDADFRTQVLKLIGENSHNKH